MDPTSPLDDDLAQGGGGAFARAAEDGGAARPMDEVMTFAYGELRRLAGAEARRSNDAILQPTALVHEAYMRLRRQRTGGWSDRRSFLMVAARVMRRVLVDRARSENSLRGGGSTQGPQADLTRVAAMGDVFEVTAIDDLLGRLGAVAPEEARTAELIVFGGLSIQEAADAQGVSSRTVDRRWRFARAWLRRELDPGR